MVRQLHLFLRTRRMRISPRREAVHELSNTSHERDEAPLVETHNSQRTNDAMNSILTFNYQ